MKRFCLTASLVLVVLSCLPGCVSAPFTGGAHEPEPPRPFTIVLLPDTQFYCQKFPETYLAQTEWIKGAAAERNIKFVIHLGDVVQTPDSEAEWEVADRAHRALDGHVPYSVLPGNHDGAPGNLSLYNAFFGPARFAQQSWYGGSISPTNNAASYCRFAAGGLRFMVLSLPYDPTETELAWANTIATAHPDDRIILATHAYLSRRGRTPTGSRIWETLVRRTPNIVMVVCGHIPAVAHRASVNDSGRNVHEILCDYQNLPNGGSGWLQTMRVDPATGTVHVEAYSPLLDEHNTAPAHTYSIDVDLLKGT